jgi:hypothetical protein
MAKIYFRPSNKPSTFLEFLGAHEGHFDHPATVIVEVPETVKQVYEQLGNRFYMVTPPGNIGKHFRKGGTLQFKFSDISPYMVRLK